VSELVLGDQGDVLRALPQRRDVDRDDAQTVVKVLPEAARPDRLVEVLVRRRDDPRLDRPRAALADPLELPLLEDAQELDLQVERDVPDLVEEDRAPAREIEAADAVADRARRARSRGGPRGERRS
jgi:hypothetical protein